VSAKIKRLLGLEAMSCAAGLRHLFSVK